MRADTAILELQRAPAVRCAVGRSLVRQHGGEEHNAAGFKRHGNGLALVDAVGENRSQNQPGTDETQYSNWQVPLADDHGKAVWVDDLVGHPRMLSLVAALRR